MSEVKFSDSSKKFEPNVALFSPIEDTLIFYRKISQDARQILNKNGLIFLEINQKIRTRNAKFIWWISSKIDARFIG